ncbi:MAG: hypothetical protein Q4C25_04835 [Bacillota bacterium]|nr:hypothetical protein [Bacillota bacterium]
MTYVIGAAAGLIFGGIVGGLKNVFIWQRYLKKTAAKTDAYDGTKGNIGGLYARASISYFVNILTLAAAFFLMDIFFFSGVAFLIGTAVALTVMNKLLVVSQKKLETGNNEKEAGQR